MAFSFYERAFMSVGTGEWMSSHSPVLIVIPVSAQEFYLFP